MFRFEFYAFMRNHEIFNFIAVTFAITCVKVESFNVYIVYFKKLLYFFISIYNEFCVILTNILLTMQNLNDSDFVHIKISKPKLTII